MNKLLNCPNCGAVVTGATCEYCGTVFYDFANMELYEAGYLRLKIGDVLNIFKAMPISISFENVAQTAMLYADDNPLEMLSTPKYEVNIRLRILPDDRGVILEKRKKG